MRRGQDPLQKRKPRSPVRVPGAVRTGLGGLARSVYRVKRPYPVRGTAAQRAVLPTKAAASHRCIAAMLLTRVDVSYDAYRCMLSHALTTEHEEVMGLLAGARHVLKLARRPLTASPREDTGDTTYGPAGELVCTVWSLTPQSRSDRRRDRVRPLGFAASAYRSAHATRQVETTPEQLAAVSQNAELAGATTGTTTRVIGWYHSHPHITVLPSAVDVRTQSTYQLLDEGFVGLIFSVFDQNSDKVGRVQVVAFQAEAARGAASGGGGDAGLTHRLVPLRVVPSQQFNAWPHRLAPLLELQRTLLAEETKAYADARAAAARDAVDASGGFVAGTAIAALHQCNVCALLSHGLAPLMRSLTSRLGQSKHQTSVFDGALTQQ